MQVDRRRGLGVAVTAGAVALLLAGCGGGAGPAPTTSGPATSAAISDGVTRTGRPTAPDDRAPTTSRGGTGMTSPDSDDTDLTITVQDGSGGVTRWRLTCDPTGGTHPQAAAACRVLAARGEAAFRPVPKDRMCTEIYGGPETATVSGTYRGRRVLATYRRTNGCEIARWDSLAGLLPAVGSGI